MVVLQESTQAKKIKERFKVKPWPLPLDTYTHVEPLRFASKMLYHLGKNLVTKQASESSRGMMRNRNAVS